MRRSPCPIGFRLIEGWAPLHSPHRNRSTIYKQQQQQQEQQHHIKLLFIVSELELLTAFPTNQQSNRIGKLQDKKKKKKMKKKRKNEYFIHCILCSPQNSVVRPFIRVYCARTYEKLPTNSNIFFLRAMYWAVRAKWLLSFESYTTRYMHTYSWIYIARGRKR